MGIGASTPKKRAAHRKGTARSGLTMMQEHELARCSRLVGMYGHGRSMADRMLGRPGGGKRGTCRCPPADNKNAPRRLPLFDPSSSQWENDDTMFYWIMSCYDENNYPSKTCTKARAFFPWPDKFEKDPYSVTPAQRRRRIFPDIDCRFDDLQSKPECAKLLTRVGATRHRRR